MKQGILWLVIVFAASTLCAQSFTNLGFERARAVPDNRSEVVVAQVLPGWTPYMVAPDFPFGVGVLYNNVCIGSPCISVFGPKRTAIQFDFVVQPAEGKFCVGLDKGSGLTVEIGLRQTGFIPATAKSLFITASDTPTIRLNDSSLAPVLFASPENPNHAGGISPKGIWGFDVSPFSGQTATLTVANSDFRFMTIDALNFSSVTVVPEPSTITLAGLGLAMLLGFRSGQIPR